MQRITLLILLLLCLPDVCIYLLHIRKLTGKRGLRLLYGVPTAVLLTGYFILWLHSGENTLAHHATSIGWLAIGILLFALPKLLFLLCSLTGILLHACLHRIPRLPFTLAGVALAIVCALGILYGSLVDVHRLQVKEVEFHSPDLPTSFDGYRLVQLSDLHLGSWSHRPYTIEKLVERVNGLHPRLIVFTGDLVNQRSCELEPFVPILQRLNAPDGVYSVLGNHDYGTYYHWPTPEAEQENLHHLCALQETMGWHLLNNAHVVLHQGSDRMALVGVENEGEPPFSQHGDLPRALQGTDGLFKILLSHNPTHWRREVLPESDVQLTLSGHTHAMQCILFGHSLASLKYPEWHGFHYAQQRALYVNIGIGYVGLPFRFNARPEITVITLRREANKAGVPEADTPAHIPSTEPTAYLR